MDVSPHVGLFRSSQQLPLSLRPRWTSVGVSTSFPRSLRGNVRSDALRRVYEIEPPSSTGGFLARRRPAPFSLTGSRRDEIYRIIRRCIR